MSSQDNVLRLEDFEDFSRWRASPDDLSSIRSVIFRPGGREMLNLNPPEPIAYTGGGRLPTLPQVTELKWQPLTSRPTRMTTEVGNFLQAFPGLQKLTISGSFVSHDHLKAFLLPFTGVLKELVLEDDLEFLEQGSVLSTGPESAIHFSSLERLDLQISHPIMISLFYGVSSSLKKLSFSLLDLENTVRALGRKVHLRPLPPSFPPLPALQELTIPVYAGLRQDITRGTLLASNNLLEATNAAELRIIKLVVSANSDAEVTQMLECHSWPTFLELASNRFPKVEELQLMFNMEMAKEITAPRKKAVEDLVNQLMNFGNRRIIVNWTHVTVKEEDFF
ncbi:hypothetical protein WG66_012940 [Moniliophthora roreri]|nr:hypothetical protein WG66_012940 [Moniliophthora roreri]